MTSVNRTSKSRERDYNPLSNDVLLQSEIVIEAQNRKIGQLRTRLKDAENLKARDNEGRNRRIRDLEEANAQLRLEVDLLQGELVAQKDLEFDDEEEGGEAAGRGKRSRTRGGEGEDVEVMVDRLEEENARLKGELEGLLKITGGTSAATLALHESVTLEDRVVALQRREDELTLSLKRLESMESCAQVASASLADSEFELAEARARIAQQKSEISRLQELLVAASKEQSMVPPTVLVLRNEAEQMRRSAATTAEQDVEEMKNFLTEKSMAIAEAADKLDRILARTAMGGSMNFPGAIATVLPHGGGLLSHPITAPPVVDTEGENVYTDLLLGLTGSVNHLSKTQKIELEKGKRLLNKISGTFLVMEVDHLKLMVLGEVIPENPADLISFVHKSIVDNSERFVARILEINKEQLNLYNDSDTQSPFAQIPTRDCLVAWDPRPVPSLPRQNRIASRGETPESGGPTQVLAIRFEKGPTSNHAECHAFQIRDEEDFRRAFHGLLYAKAIPEGSSISGARPLTSEDNHLCSVVFASHLDSSFVIRNFHLPTQRVVWQHADQNAVVFSPRKDPTHVSEIVLAENAILQIDQESFCLKLWCFDPKSKRRSSDHENTYSIETKKKTNMGDENRNESCVLIGVLFPPNVEGFISNVSAAMKLKWRNCYIGEKGFQIPGEALHNGYDRLLTHLGQKVPDRRDTRAAAPQLSAAATRMEVGGAGVRVGGDEGRTSATAPAVPSMLPPAAPATPGLAANLTPGMTVGVTAGASPALQRADDSGQITLSSTQPKGPEAQSGAQPKRKPEPEPWNCLRIHDGICEVIATADALKPIAVLPAKTAFASCDDTSRRIVLTRLEGELMVEQFIFVFKQRKGGGSPKSSDFYSVNKERLKDEGFTDALLPSGAPDMGGEVVCVDRSSSLKVFSDFSTQFQPDLSCLAGVHRARILFDRQEVEITERNPDGSMKRIKVQAGKDEGANAGLIFQRWCFALLLAGLIKDVIQMRHLGVEPLLSPVPPPPSSPPLALGPENSNGSQSQMSSRGSIVRKSTEADSGEKEGVIPEEWLPDLRQYLFAVGNRRGRRRSTMTGMKRYAFVHGGKFLIFPQSFTSASRATVKPVYTASPEDCRVSVTAITSDRKIYVNRFVGTGNEDLLSVAFPAGDEEFEQLLRDLVKANFSINKIDTNFVPSLSSLLPSSPTLEASARKLDVFATTSKNPLTFSISSDLYQASLISASAAPGSNPAKVVVRFEPRAISDPRVAARKDDLKSASAFEEELNSSNLKAEKRKFNMILFVANFATPIWIAEDHKRPFINFTVIRSLNPPPPLTTAAAAPVVKALPAVPSSSTSSAESFDLKRGGSTGPGAKTAAALGKERVGEKMYAAPPWAPAAAPVSVAEALALFLELEKTPGLSDAQKAELADLKNYMTEVKDLDAATQFLNDARAIALLPSLQGRWDALERFVRAPRKAGGKEEGEKKPMVEMIPEACDQLAAIMKEGKYSGPVMEELAKVSMRLREFAAKEGTLAEREEVENLVAYARRVAENEEMLKRDALRRGLNPDQAVATAILNGRRASEMAGANEGKIKSQSLLDLLENANKAKIPKDMEKVSRSPGAKFPNLYEYKTDLKEIMKELTLRTKPNTAEEVSALRKDVTDLNTYFFRDAPEFAKQIKNLHWAVTSKSPNPGEAKRLAQATLNVLESAGVKTPEEEEQERAAKEAAEKVAAATQKDMEEFFAKSGITPPEGLSADGLWFKSEEELEKARAEAKRELEAKAAESRSRDAWTDPAAAAKAEENRKKAEEQLAKMEAVDEARRRQRKSVMQEMRRRSVGYKRLGLERYELPPMPEDLEKFEKRDRSKFASSDLVPTVAEKKARARRGSVLPAKVPLPRGSILTLRGEGPTAGVNDDGAKDGPRKSRVFPEKGDTRRRASVATGLQALKELTKKFEQVNVARSETTGRPLPFARKRPLKTGQPDTKSGPKGAQKSPLKSKQSKAGVNFSEPARKASRPAPALPPKSPGQKSSERSALGGKSAGKRKADVSGKQGQPTGKTVVRIKDPKEVSSLNATTTKDPAVKSTAAPSPVPPQASPTASPTASAPASPRSPKALQLGPRQKQKAKGKAGKSLKAPKDSKLNR